MSIKSFYIKKVIVVAIFLIIGCNPIPRIRRYSEPRLPRDKVAILRIYSPLYLVSVDGENLRSAGRRGIELELLPGPHKIAINYYKTKRFATSRSSVIRNYYWSKYDRFLQFEVKPGHTYSVLNSFSGFLAPPKVTCNIKIFDETEFVFYNEHGRLTKF